MDGAWLDGPWCQTDGLNRQPGFGIRRTESRQWLVEHRDRLQSISAVGMLVQADTLEDLRRVAQLAGGLAILPASATDIAKALGIRHYPVLILSHGIEQ